MRILKKILPEFFWKILIRLYHAIKITVHKTKAIQFYFIKTSKPRVIMIGAPSHGNCGDIAIAVAQTLFLKHLESSITLVDIDMEQYAYQISCWQRVCKPEDIFVLIGGGNFGNQYMHDEAIRRDLIERFPNNKIVMFPQSIYFTNDQKGREELEVTRRIYNSHRHLILTARDKVSYNMMCAWFKHQILLVPDIVLYLELSLPNVKRNGALLCLRKDVEGILNDGQKQVLKYNLSQQYEKVHESDTLVNYKGKKSTRTRLMMEKLLEFKSTELVVTDRIHGMIFAAITSTPCVVLSNYNHKVKGAYAWLKDLKYIHYADTMEQALEYILQLKGVSAAPYSNSIYRSDYIKLAEALSLLDS